MDIRPEGSVAWIACGRSGLGGSWQSRAQVPRSANPRSTAWRDYSEADGDAAAIQSTSNSGAPMLVTELAAAGVADRLPVPLGHHGHVDVRDPERRLAVHHGVHQGWRCSGRAGLAAAHPWRGRRSRPPREPRPRRTRSSASAGKCGRCITRQFSIPDAPNFGGTNSLGTLPISSACEFAHELSAVTSARRIFEWTPVATNSGGALSCARIGRMQCLCLSSAAERSPRDRFCW